MRSSGFGLLDQLSFMCRLDLFRFNYANIQVVQLISGPLNAKNFSEPTFTSVFLNPSLLKKRRNYQVSCEPSETILFDFINVVLRGCLVEFEDCLSSQVVRHGHAAFIDQSWKLEQVGDSKHRDDLKNWRVLGW